MANLKLERVARWRQMSALRFLVAGDERDELVEMQARMLRQQIHSGQVRDAQLWWARRWPRKLAAVLVLENAGKTAMLFSSPAQAPGVDAAVLVRLVSQVCGDVLAGDVTLVQALLPSDAQADAAVLRQASFTHLANLAYMRLELDKPPQPEAHVEQEVAHVEFKTFGQYTEVQLVELIKATYVESLDCPGLEGVRDVADVVTGHKASGIFRPQSWFVAYVEGKAAGCLLMNDSLVGDSGEVVYLGVSRDFRGMGIGRKLLAHAIADARARRLSTLALAVDSQNAHARKLYDQCGFVQTQTRSAYVRFAARIVRNK